MTNILIVDDEKDIRELIGDILKDEGVGIGYAHELFQVFVLLGQLGVGTHIGHGVRQNDKLSYFFKSVF